MSEQVSNSAALQHGGFHVELHVPEFKSARSFYGSLGFELVWEDTSGPLGYLVMQKGTAVFCFWPGNAGVHDQPYFKQFPQDTKRGFGVELVVLVDDLDAIYETALSLNAVVEPLKTQPWGLRDFRIEDPYGYYVRFNDPHDILSK